MRTLLVDIRHFEVNQAALSETQASQARYIPKRHALGTKAGAGENHRDDE